MGIEAARLTGVSLAAHCEIGTLANEILDLAEAGGLTADRVALVHMIAIPTRACTASSPDAARTCSTTRSAGSRIVDLAVGQIGGQALPLGLVDQVVIDVVPVVFGSGRPFFGAMGPGDVVALDNPTRVVQGKRVTHLLYGVS